MKPILFLDIDGVLNSAEWMRYGRMGDDWEDHFCPALCARLERVVRETGCEIVLSSSWRIAWTTDAIETFIRNAGAPSVRIIGATPSWRMKSGVGVIGAYERRGQEIDAWISAHPEVQGRPFAIVDDDDDMGPLRRRLVLTTWARGLQDEHVERLIHLLVAR